MKRKITLSIALILSIVSVLLTGSDSRVAAQNQTRYRAGTGVITPGANQTLSVVIVSGEEDNVFSFRFRQTRYLKTGCADGVCRYVIESQTTSPAMISAPNQSSKLDVIANQIGPDRAVSVEVLSSSRNARVNVQLSDTVTGQVDSVLIALLLP